MSFVDIDHMESGVPLFQQATAEWRQAADTFGEISEALNATLSMGNPADIEAARGALVSALDRCIESKARFYCTPERVKYMLASVTSAESDSTPQEQMERKIVAVHNTRELVNTFTAFTSAGGILAPEDAKWFLENKDSASSAWESYATEETRNFLRRTVQNLMIQADADMERLGYLENVLADGHAEELRLRLVERDAAVLREMIRDAMVAMHTFQVVLDSFEL